MKKIIFVLLSLVAVTKIQAQLSGVLNVPSTYTSLASVITALNQQGVSGAVTVNIAAGHTETAIPGGFSLTVGGSSLSPIIFRKGGSGSNPLLVAYTGGSGTPGSMNQDGIFRLIGCDYITIDGIDVADLNTSNPSTMEFGYGLFKANANDGCQNNTIKNCVITLNKINNAGGSGPSSDGSRGIDVINASPGAQNAVISVSSFPGSNSYNKFYGNTIQNCNIGISLIGFADVSPFAYADSGNDVGGNSISTGNTIINFGGGASANAAAGIKTLAQYDLNVAFNTINNNTGVGINHPGILRGIHSGAAVSANTSIHDNTLTLNGGGTSSQISIIENASGSIANSNTVAITNNHIVNSTYATATSAPFYGIWNTASCDNLLISNNIFVNNSTSAASGSTYLIYNNGAVPSQINLDNNSLSFSYNGPVSYAGSLYGLYNANGTATSTLSIQNNSFSNFNHLGFTGTGNLYFISNTNDSYVTTLSNNTWTNLFLNHSGAEYLINNASSTQALLNVSANSISGAYNRTAPAGAMYLYYSAGSSPASCIQTYSGNIFSNITAPVAGTGNFYGIYTADGSASPYPQKNIYQNEISNVSINSTGTFYGFYLDNLGDASGSSPSSVYNNTLTSISRNGTIYGIYLTSSVSPNYAPQIYANTIQYLTTSGWNSTIYSAYLSGGGAGLHFYKNKITDVIATGTSGIVHGIYLPGAVNTLLSNNYVGNINSPNSSATNAVNGIYINGGSNVSAFYNTVYLNAISANGNYNSNAIYSSSTVSLTLRNNCFINVSSTGTGITATFRRSSTSLTNYMSASNTNLFYAGNPGATNVILQNGTTAYQTLATFKTALSPKEAASVTQNISFLNTFGYSLNYLHVSPNNSSALESAAVNINGIIDDFDSESRHGSLNYSGSGSAPDIGADEYNQNLIPCTSANAGTISALTTSLCSGQSATLISNGYTSGTGITHQWQISATSGGSYTNVAAGVGATTPEFISSALTQGTYYFILNTTCSVTSASVSSTEFSIVVNTAPIALAQVVSTLVCAGQSLTLNGVVNSAGSYQWLGPNGYNTTLQNPILTNVNTLNSGVYYFSATQNNCTSPQTTVMINVSDITLTLNATSTVLCIGNTATLSLLTSGITYSWSTNSNLSTITISPGVTSVYSIVVTNTANCTLSKTISIAVINPSISANNTVVCGSAGLAILSVNAFTPSSINWYSSLTSTTSLASGINYSVNTSTTNTFYAEASNSVSGCQSVRIPVTVTVSPNPILIVAANPSVVCPSSSCVISANGASTYSWTSIGSGSLRTVSPTSAHIYTVTGKNILGCVSVQTLLVTTYTIPIITTVQSATTVCPSALVSFTATGANSYFWNTGANGPVNTVTVAVNSTYTVYGTNTESCTSTKTIAVITRSVPVVSILQSTSTLCPGELITFTATGASSYTWFPGGIISHTYSANPFVSSVYNAVGKSINTCTNVGIASVVVDLCNGIRENELAENILIFPNPSGNKFNFMFSSPGKRHFKIISSCGELIIFGEIENETILDLSSFSKGIYVIEIFSLNEIIRKKLCLE